MAADDRHPSAAPTPARLRRLAGESFFERGEAYFADGAVRSLRRRDDGVEAQVQGTRTYRVRLRLGDGELDHLCTCPVGQEGIFCKHCAAVGLAWHAGGLDDAGEAVLGEEDLRVYLQSLDREALVALLLAQAKKDERLSRRLLVAAAQAKGSPTDLSVWKEAFATALKTDGFVPYREAADYACGIEEVIGSLGDFLRQGRAANVILLAEHGLAELEEELDHVDDSDGWLGGLLDKLQELHLEACRLARPDPAALAERLFAWEMETDYDIFHRAAGIYADVLGEPGLAVYRRLAEAEWARVRPLGPGDEDSDRYGRRFRIGAVVETIAGIEGDLEALVAIKSRDLSLPYGFLEIAELYRGAGEPERALEWAERGWQAFAAERQDPRLRAFLAEAYQAGGRHDDAMALIWQAFTASPSIETYEHLEKHAKVADQCPAWRQKALALISERLAREPAPAPTRPVTRPVWQRDIFEDRSLLVEIFLHEGDVEAAWREAQAGGCSAHLWLALARRREESHPAQSVEVYQSHIAALLRHTGDGVYREAVAFLEKIKMLYARLGEDEAFRALLRELRAAQRRKRKLMQMLDGKGW